MTFRSDRCNDGLVKVSEPSSLDATERSAASGTALRGTLRRVRYDLDKRPFLVIWELTRACDLACRHCRATSQHERDPNELTTEQGFSLLEQVASFGLPRPVVILSGGDPFKRPDLYELVARASQLGLAISVSPSVTPLATREGFAALRAAGAVSVSLSIDGASGATHDAFRQVEGSFERTVSAAMDCSELGLRFQMNTTVTPHDIDELADIALLARRLGAMTWSVFFLVQTGRGRDLDLVSAREADDLMSFIYDTGKHLAVKTTEAPQYRRVVIQRRVLEKAGVPPGEVLTLLDRSQELSARFRAGIDQTHASGSSDAKARRLATQNGGRDVGAGSAGSPLRRPPMEINAGKGFAFVSHTGDVYPSGFLPIPAGNVRDESIASIYRNSDLFRSLRDEGRLEGRCSRCEFRRVCGGSRSRAFASSGSPWGEDPLCEYRASTFPYQEELAPYLV
jgi:radical SAM protein